MNFNPTLMIYLSYKAKKNAIKYEIDNNLKRRFVFLSLTLSCIIWTRKLGKYLMFVLCY